MHRRFLSAALYAITASVSTSSVMAADNPTPTNEDPLVVPRYPSEKAPASTPPSPPRYVSYRNQVVIPTAIFDAMFWSGFVAASLSHNRDLSMGLWVSGAIGRSLSGPIVHLAHGHGLRALASLGLESTWLSLGLPTAYAGQRRRLIGKWAG